MLLRAGLLMAVFSVLLAAAVALMVGLRADAPAAQGAWTKPAASETPARENNSNPGEKLEIDDETGEEAGDEPGGSEPGGSELGSEPGGSEPVREQPRQEGSDPGLEIPPRGEESVASPEAGEEPAPKEEGGPELLPVSSADWPAPSREELIDITQPRYYDPAPGAALTLTIEALGLYDVPIFDSYGEEALDWGIMHVPDTAYPWDEADQKNVFLAGHRVGLPGTDGRMLFFALDELVAGDDILLEDSDGNVYTYRVKELFRVEPDDGWVADTLVDRDLLTLQTCTYPTFEDRLIVRADRV